MKSTRKFNEENERIKRSTCGTFATPRALSENSVNKASEAILRLEKATDFKPFSKLNGDDVLQFKEHLSGSATGKTGKPMVAASRVNIQVCVRAFVHWLADQTGYKSKITHSFADHFSPQQKGHAGRQGIRIKPTATIEQADHTFRLMPTETVLDRRNRAFFALMMLTAARIEAAASLKIGHVDLSMAAFTRTVPRSSPSLARPSRPTLCRWHRCTKIAWQNGSTNLPRSISSARRIRCSRNRTSSSLRASAS